MIQSNLVVRAACVLVVAVASQPVLAQMPTLTGVAGLSTQYQEPTNQAHRPIYDRLKNRQVLEQFQEFMSPLRLKRSLTVVLQGCNGVINAMYQGGKITYCYELIAETQRRISETNVLPGFRREDALVGGFVNTLLHETGHAIFDLLSIPIFGREEDAADAVASYVALQFGPTTARRILTGTAFVWRASELASRNRGNRGFDDYADEHGTHAQRFYNTLCIALGSDIVERQKTFQDFSALLPDYRRGHCGREYQHVKNSFARFVLPHVDQALLKKVRTVEWLRSEDGTDVLPPPTPDGPRTGPGPGTPGKGPGPATPPGGSPTPGPLSPPSPR